MNKCRLCVFERGVLLDVLLAEIDGSLFHFPFEIRLLCDGFDSLVFLFLGCLFLFVFIEGCNFVALT